MVDSASPSGTSFRSTEMVFRKTAALLASRHRGAASREGEGWCARLVAAGTGNGAAREREIDDADVEVVPPAQPFRRLLEGDVREDEPSSGPGHLVGHAGVAQNADRARPRQRRHLASAE